MEFGALTFLAPLGLLGLLAVPLIYWILKATPPRPKEQAFPPIRILADVVTEEETPDKTPWWLLLFRMAMMAIIAVALARPILFNNTEQTVRDVVMVIDNGYGAASNWSQITREAEDRLDEARRNNSRVALLPSYAPGQAVEEPVIFGPAQAAIDALALLDPAPLPADHIAAMQRIEDLDIGDANVIWLSSGINYGAAQTLAAKLSDGAQAEILLPNSESRPLLAGEIAESQNGFRISYHRLDSDSVRQQTAIAYGADGRVIGQAELNFGAGQSEAEAEFELPADLRNRVSFIRPEGSNSAGSIKLLDDSWGRPVVGILEGSEDNTQPLLSDVYYVDKALGPNADIFKGEISDLLPLGPSIIVMSDNSRIEDDALTEFVDNGGLLIRFAGPKLAARSDELLPVDLRFGDRALGGALTWEDPQNLAPFEEDSPFFGLIIPEEINVTQQVMAQPGAQTDIRTWARLTDGSPIVTSAVRGQGRIVLFHVTSGPEWSNLAISGLYVSMLKRILPMARATPASSTVTGGSWSAERTLDAFGRLSAPPLTAQPVQDGTFDSVKLDETHLPGLYRQGPRRTALNTVRDMSPLSSTAGTNGLREAQYSDQTSHSLTATLLLIGLIMLIIDAIIALWLTGRFGALLPKRKIASTTAIALIGASLIMHGVSPAPAHAQSASVETDALALHFAYVVTGDSRLDRKSSDGLKGVSEELTRRTTVEPAEPRGVNIETDSLVIYPFIYWPVTRDAAELSDAASKAVNAYMESGGTVVFDTQDEGERALRLGAQHPGLANISKSLDIPTLKAVPEDHVLNKSFFLLEKYPGRWADGQVWVDAESIGARDGVASVIIGSNDWASAWAISSDGEFYGSLEETMPRQREFAKRFGVNLAMYVLSGNYKADQVHVPALLERLGDSGTTDLEGPRDIINVPRNPLDLLDGGE